MATTSRLDKVDLIPWDFTSAEHITRMLDQRFACGWRWEQIDQWKQEQAAGEKCLYWVVLGSDFDQREELLAKHTAKYAKEATPLVDTAKFIRLTDRKPSLKEFVPVGHVALEIRPREDEHLGLTKGGGLREGEGEGGDSGGEGSGIYWIATLYVSWAIQRGGLGRAAMEKAEWLATQEPLCGKTLVLDAVPSEFQRSPDVVKRVYTDRGNPVPAVTNEEWYKRQGYVEFHREDNGYEWPTEDGGVSKVPLIFMKKSLI